MPYDILANGHFVTGTERFEYPRYRGKAVWQSIMIVTDETSVLYLHRVVSGFDSQVGADAPAKAKARV